MTRVIDLTRQRYGKLLVKEFAYLRNRCAFWKCLCKCGNIYIASANHLKRGTESCGCKKFTHGKSKSREYISWQAMKDRCTNKNNKHYRHYGERGITICKRWSRFETFLKDMGERPPGTSLHRVNNDKGYCPSNCKWADQVTQLNCKRNNVYLTINGKTQTIAQWSRESGLSYQTIRGRKRLGWDDAECLSPYRPMIRIS